MSEIKTVIFVAAFLLAATGFCTFFYQVKPKMGHHGEIKSESPCVKEYKKFCMNGDKRFYLADENIAACNCTSMYGGKRCEKYM